MFMTKYRPIRADSHTEMLEDAVMQHVRETILHKDGDMLRTRCHDMERRLSIPALQTKMLEGAMLYV